MARASGPAGGNSPASEVPRRGEGDPSALPEATYRLIVDAANEGIWLLDGEGRIEFVNRRIAEMFGYGPEQMIGRPVSDFLEKESQQEARWRLQRCHEGIAQKFDFAFRRSDGTRLWALVSCNPIRNESGVFDRTLAMLVDLTDRREAEDALRQRERLLRALLTRVETVREEERVRIARQIHDELGQSLSVMRMELDRLRRLGQAGAGQAPETIDSLLGMADSTLETVRDLSTELRPIVLDAFGLKAAVKWKLQKFSQRTGIGSRMQGNRTAIPPDPHRSAEVFRIFQEALTNVERHARATAVTVSLDQVEKELSLVIEDDGVGIPDHKLAEPASLGLLGMRERALTIGGRIAFGQRPEGGTRVELRVPLELAGP